MVNTLILFLTHNFKPVFEKTVNSINTKAYDVHVLLDSNNPMTTNNIKSTVKIIPIKRKKMVYDYFGHTMYIQYFRDNSDVINRYKYIYVIENDVYFSGNINSFLSYHEQYDNDVLVTEIGLRKKNWMWFKTLVGFPSKTNDGCKAFITRFSSNFLNHLVINLEVNFNGYLEAIIPCICHNTHFSISTFVHNFIGVVTVDPDNKIITKIRQDILNKKYLFIEPDKLYHPIKL
jgi:hypothetical protein